MQSNILIMCFDFLIFVYMEYILPHPESAEQLKTVNAVLKALNVQFEPQSNVLPSRIVKSVDKSIKQYEGGQTISLEELQEKHFSKK
jgi:hypothetical protein